MKKKRLLVFISLVGCLLASCSFRNQQSNVVWSKWHDNGDGTHTRHALNDITIQETDVHHFSLLKTNIEPTDVAPGKATYSCDECGAKEERVVPPPGNYVFDQKVVAPQYLYEKCSEHSSIYYMSSKEGAYGNPDCLFEVSDIGDEYTEVDVAHSDGSQYINTGVKNTTEYLTEANYSSGKRIPGEYAVVEYLKSTGTQYIDTKYVVKNENIKISISCSLDLSAIHNLSLFGSCAGNGQQYVLTPYHSDDYGEGVFRHWQGSSANLMEITLNNGLNNLVYDVTEDSIVATANDTSYASTYTGSPLNESNLYIFGLSANNTIKETGSGYTLYNFSLHENGKEVRNMIPVVRFCDNKPGLYDTISKSFFTNSGTGEFEAGPIVNNNSRLPNDYTELTYIESTGTQFINSRINSGTTIDVYADLQIVGNDVNQTIFGTTTEAGTSLNVSVTAEMWQLGNALWSNAPDTTLNNRHSIRCHFENQASYLEVDNTRIITSTNVWSHDNNDIYLFNHFDRYYSAMKLYSCSIYSNGELVRNFIPCFNSSTDETGLYDLVSDEFFKNSGTGVFLRGDSIVSNSRLPNGYTELTYIESTGTQYLDTEVAWVNGTAMTYEITLQFTTPGPSKGVGHHRANVGRDSSNNIVLGSQTVNVNSQEKHTYKIEWEKGNYESSLLRTGYVDGVSLCSTHIQPLDERTFFLFACTGWTTDDGRPPYSFENVRIFETKFYRDGNLIKHFVPAYSQINTQYGMYELIQKKFYENQGTGDFLPGEIVNSNAKLPSKYSEVEYIKFDGTQFIDTHISEDATWHFDLKWECSGVRELIGYGGSSAEYFGISSTGYYSIWETSDVTCGNRDNVIFNYSTSGISLKVNDTYAYQLGGHSEISVGSFKFGGLSIDGSIISYANAGLTLYSVQAYVGESLIASYKPCIDNSSGKAGLYEEVSNEFFGDVFNGTFETGAVVGNIGSEIAQETEDLNDIEPVALPASYHQLAYVNVAGYHSISTGIAGTMKLEMVANFKNVHAQQSFGYNAETTIFSIDKNGKYYPSESRVGNKDAISLDIGDTEETQYTATLNGTKVIDTTLTLKNKKDTLKLFSVDGKSGVYGKVYSVKIFKKNVLKMNLVPAKNIYLNEVGFYDTVSESFLTSSNNIEFTGGNDMNIDIDMSNINMFISRYSNEKILQKSDMSDFKIFNSKNEMIRDFVPALRNSDGKLGFYEVVEKKFYESPIGNEFTYDEKVGHIFGDEKTIVKPTHSTNAEKETVCKICGRHVHEKIDRLSYQVTFQLPTFIQTVKIFQELDPSKYEISTVGYTRNVSTYNYSKVNAWICFEVVMDEDIPLVVTASNGKVRKLTNTKYEITNIVHDCVITIAKKA